MRSSAQNMDIFTYIVIIIVNSSIPAIVLFPVIALLLWALTFVSALITFSWIFVIVMGTVASLIGGLILTIVGEK